jgi:signal transduction histidine kinase
MIEVLDHGTGMSEYVRTRAFDRYFSTRRHPRSGARGLGLAEARVRVEALGGRIELESAVDRGTRASIRLPARGRPGSGW